MARPIQSNRGRGGESVSRVALTAKLFFDLNWVN